MARLDRMEATTMAMYKHHVLIIFLETMLMNKLNISRTRNGLARIENAALGKSIDAPLVPLCSTNNQAIAEFPPTILDLERLSGKDVVILVEYARRSMY